MAAEKLTQRPAWKALIRHFTEIERVKMKDMFKEDSERFDKFSLPFNDILFDYSKNRINEETMELLIALARECNVESWREKMFSGERINSTEDRSVLHTALRNRSDKPIHVSGNDVMPEIRNVLSRIQQFAHNVRTGKWLGYTGEPVKDVVNIGIGGSDLGPKMVCTALTEYKHSDINFHFLSNVDSSHIKSILDDNDLRPETTLFIVASKTFTTQETLRNAKTARKWWLDMTSADENEIAKHFVAISTNTEEVVKFGIDPENMFEFWDWVGGRYSLWSAIGLAITIAIGMDNFNELLDGAYEMDQHFQNAPLEENIPVIMGMLGIWYNNFFDAESSAVLPYDYHLREFPAYLEQADMESNGKSVDRDSRQLDYSTGSIVWGAEGNNGQHAFYQLIHQGTKLIPTDFIISAIKRAKCNQAHRNILVANFLAQTEALMVGRSEEETREQLYQAGVQLDDLDQKVPHMVFEGNLPSNSILFKELTPKTLGSLIAMYEHKIFVQGIIWNLNSYDQWGVELGKHLANKILEDIEKDEDIHEHDASTQGLLNQFKSFRQAFLDESPQKTIEDDED